MRSAAAAFILATVAGATAGLGAGCGAHSGPGWTQPPPPPGAREATVVVVGESTGGRGRTTARVGERLGEVLDGETAAGRATVVAWIGSGGCGAPASPITEALRRRLGSLHVTEVPAADGRRCDLAGEQPQDLVLRIDRTGGARVVSSCDDAACRVEPPPDSALVDLVVVDAVAWQHPRAEASAAEAAALEQRLDHLLDAAAAAPVPARLLVVHHPIESAGVHGGGGRWPDATWHQTPPPLQRALAAGMFAGVLSAHERSLQVIDDLPDAALRADKAHLPRPVFQVISGAAVDPDVRHPRRLVPLWRGTAAHPRLWSDHAGFAVLHLDPREGTVTLHARRRGRWVTGSTTVPLDGRDPSARNVVGQQPCRACADVPAAARP